MSVFWDYEKKASENHVSPESEAAHWLRLLEERAGSHLSALLFAARESSDPAVIRAVEDYDREREGKQRLRVTLYGSTEETP